LVQVTTVPALTVIGVGEKEKLEIVIEALSAAGGGGVIEGDVIGEGEGDGAGVGTGLGTGVGRGWGVAVGDGAGEIVGAGAGLVVSDGGCGEVPGQPAVTNRAAKIIIAGIKLMKCV
jgi:hypothetical protein